MNKTLNVGIIGCGMIAFNKHLPALKKHDNINIKAFHNRTHAKALEAQKQFGTLDSVCYETADALINDETLDVIHILTANDSHSELTIKALKANKHVLVEKPLAKNEAEAHNVLKIAQASDKYVSISYQNRFTPQIKHLKTMIDNGELGEINMIKASSIRRRGIPSWGVFTNKAIQGGGPLIDIGSHIIESAMYLLDYPSIQYLSGSMYQNIEVSNINKFGPLNNITSDVEDYATGFIKTVDGKTLSIEASYAINKENEGENIIEVYGTKKGAIIDNDLRVNYTDETGYITKTIQVEPSDPAVSEIHAFINALLNDEIPPITIEQGYKVNQIIEQIYTSAKRNQPIIIKD